MYIKAIGLKDTSQESPKSFTLGPESLLELTNQDSRSLLFQSTGSFLSSTHCAW